MHIWKYRYRMFTSKQVEQKFMNSSKYFAKDTIPVKISAKGKSFCLFDCICWQYRIIGRRKSNGETQKSECRVKKSGCWCFVRQATLFNRLQRTLEAISGCHLSNYCMSWQESEQQRSLLVWPTNEDDQLRGQIVCLSKADPRATARDLATEVSLPFRKCFHKETIKCRLWKNGLYGSVAYCKPFFSHVNHQKQLWFVWEHLCDHNFV